MQHSSSGKSNWKVKPAFSTTSDFSKNMQVQRSESASGSYAEEWILGWGGDWAGKSSQWDQNWNAHIHLESCKPLLRYSSDTISTQGNNGPSEGIKIPRNKWTAQTSLETKSAVVYFGNNIDKICELVENADWSTVTTMKWRFPTDQRRVDMTHLGVQA